MSNAETRTLEQVVLELALLEVPCNGFFGHGVVGENLTPDPHPFDCAHGCLGTGKVAKYPTLRGPCENLAFHMIRPRPGKEYLCCQGRGWLPVTTTDALLEAGKPYNIAVRWATSEWQSDYDNLEWPYTTERVAADTQQMALALALEVVQ